MIWPFGFCLECLKPVFIVNYTYCFVYIEPPLYPMNEFYLIMVNDLCDIFLLDFPILRSICFLCMSLGFFAFLHWLFCPNFFSSPILFIWIFSLHLLVNFVKGLSVSVIFKIVNSKKFKKSDCSIDSLNYLCLF